MGYNEELFDRVARLGEQLQKLNNNRRMLDEARAKVVAVPRSSEEFRSLRMDPSDARSPLAYQRMEQQRLSSEIAKGRQ